MGVKITNPAMQPHAIDRGLGLNIVISIVAAMGEPELIKLLNGVVSKVGKENAGPVLLGFKSAVDAVIKKNKIKG